MLGRTEHACKHSCSLTLARPRLFSPPSVISLKDKGFGILLEAVLAADKSILETLSNPRLEATVFAPDDKAFQRLLKDLHISKRDLLKNKELLTQVG